jgi:pimeloyl-ACP methyl ester carboxylesterase
MTGVCEWILAAAGALAAAYVFVSFGAHFWLPRDHGGEAAEGIVIWVESLRFLGLKWGMRTVPHGLRRAGFRGEFLFWEWHRRWEGFCQLPALRNRGQIDRQARRLADFITERRAALPTSPVHIVAYSAGGFVAVQALEMLPAGVSVQSAAMLACAFSPRHDLSAALAHVERRMLVASSPMDFLILGLGTLLCGGSDQVHSAGIGMVGAMDPHGRRAFRHPRLVPMRWRPAMLLEGNLGGHRWGINSRFIEKYVAPWIAGE